MPTLPEGRLWVLSFSIVLSCVVMGISISLLLAPTSSTSSTSSWINYTGGWQGPRSLSHRDHGPPVPGDQSGFRVVQILATAASASNLLFASVLLAASSMKRKTVLSVVAVEAPCIYIVSFLWLATGAYAEHRADSGPYFPFLNTRECIRYKVMEGIAFVNWIQLMLYANTLMTVATICHVRKPPVWFHPIAELPTFSAPALTFNSNPDMGFDQSLMTKTNESEVPILAVSSSQSVDSRTPSHFRSRLPFLPNPALGPGMPPDLSSPPAVPPTPRSDSASLAPSEEARSDIIASQNAQSHPRTSTGHQVVPMGEPPTYTDPDSNNELPPV
ncbi:hypothetical protein F5148DRAFT_1372923 [Russula earlei]|uniref:Uncharacterized protein n=1 Tax=Russula earlei TaxID=71964 RepID=A0ACC0UMG9_9AGAM|nr:hypothetical protein F5148DRAFT_1372923 [Russula earlei]